MGPTPRRTNGAAVASLILGILGCVPFITGVFAVILGIVGISKAKQPATGGKGMAIAGIILGLLSIILWAAFGGGIYALVRGTAPVRDAGRQFVTDLAKGNVNEAAAMCTTDIPKQTCEGWSQHLQSLGTLKDTTVMGMSVNTKNGETMGAVSGMLEFSKGNTSFTLVMIKQDGKWKVKEATFPVPNK